MITGIRKIRDSNTEGAKSVKKTCHRSKFLAFWCEVLAAEQVRREAAVSLAARHIGKPLVFNGFLFLCQPRHFSSVSIMQIGFKNETQKTQLQCKCNMKSYNKKIPQKGIPVICRELPSCHQLYASECNTSPCIR